MLVFGRSFSVYLLRRRGSDARSETSVSEHLRRSEALANAESVNREAESLNREPEALDREAESLNREP